jgi:Co/Zn/Cd efflux system component
MNGVLLFGWSTAILFYLVQRFWSEQQMQAEVGEP